jgi:hypothetical protein
VPIRLRENEAAAPIRSRTKTSGSGDAPRTLQPWEDHPRDVDADPGERCAHDGKRGEPEHERPADAERPLPPVRGRPPSASICSANSASDRSDWTSSTLPSSAVPVRCAATKIGAYVSGFDTRVATTATGRLAHRHRTQRSAGDLQHGNQQPEENAHRCTGGYAPAGQLPQPRAPQHRPEPAYGPEGAQLLFSRKPSLQPVAHRIVLSRSRTIDIDAAASIALVRQGGFGSGALDQGSPAIRARIVAQSTGLTK